MRKKSPRVNCQREISELNLQRGETITIWMQISNNTRIQVELRVDHDNKAQIFVNEDVPVQVIPFKDWNSIYDDY